MLRIRKGTKYFENALLLVFGLLFLLLTSCLTVVKDLKTWIEFENINEVSGVYYLLSDDKIKAFLPDTFKKYSTVAYQQLLDSLTTKEDYELEIKRLQHLREADGNFYIFFDEETRSTYTVNTMPYMPLLRGDAKYILGMISMNNEKISQKKDLKFTKITAKYNANASVQIFKAIYRIDHTNKHLTSFNTSYIISSNNKTMYVQLLTGFDVNFDPFLQKMIF